jgi:GNAT superfamily N-acetyltransferase
MSLHIIRKATIDDLPQLSNLFDRYRVFYKKQSDLAAANNFLSERIINKESEIYVAESEDEKLVGFTQLYPLFSSTRMLRLWLLNDLYVQEAYRGKGISKQLIEAAKQLTKDTNACGMLLETAKDNTVGNQLYPATGFTAEENSNFYFWTNK